MTGTNGMPRGVGNRLCPTLRLREAGVKEGVGIAQGPRPSGGMMGGARLERATSTV